MYLRHSTVRKNGKTHTYWRLVKSVRHGAKVRQQTVAQLGELDAKGRASAKKLAELITGNRAPPGLFDEPGADATAPVEVVLSGVRLERARRFGDVFLGWTLWRALGFDELLEELVPRGREDVAWSTMAAVHVISRLCSPSSDLHIAEDFYRKTALAALLRPCARSLGWVVAPTSELTGRILDRVRSVLHQHFKHRLVEDDPGEQRIVVRNFGGGLSELRGKTADNAVSLLGEAVDWLVIDEAAKLKSAIWESYLSQRLIDRRGWALLISTPRGRGYFYTLYRRGQRRRDPAYQSWSAPSWQNPHVDRGTIEEERSRQSADVFAQEYEGRFLGVHAEPCETCGAPDPDVTGSFATRLYRETGDIVLVQAALTHRSIASTLVYAQPREADLRRALRA